MFYCENEHCEKRASFGKEGGHAKFCGDHKGEEHVNVVRKSNATVTALIVWQSAPPAGGSAER